MKICINYTRIWNNKLTYLTNLDIFWWNCTLSNAAPGYIHWDRVSRRFLPMDSPLVFEASGFDSSFQCGGSSIVRSLSVFPMGHASVPRQSAKMSFWLQKQSLDTGGNRRSTKTHFGKIIFFRTCTVKKDFVKWCTTGKSFAHTYRYLFSTLNFSHIKFIIFSEFILPVFVEAINTSVMLTFVKGVFRLQWPLLSDVLLII